MRFFMDMEQIDHCLQSALPGDAVRKYPEDLERVRVRNPVIEPGETPSHVVVPRDREELQGLVRRANENGLNLTVSSSRGSIAEGGPVLSIQASMWICLSGKGWKGSTAATVSA